MLPLIRFDTLVLLDCCLPALCDKPSQLHCSQLVIHNRTGTIVAGKYAQQSTIPTAAWFNFSLLYWGLSILDDSAMDIESRQAKYRGCLLLASVVMLVVVLACSLGYVSVQAGVTNAPDFIIDLGGGRELRSIKSRGSCPGQNIELCVQWEYSILYVPRRYQAYTLISMPLKHGWR